jgi:hypothetical protein
MICHKKNLAGISFAESLSGTLTKEDPAALRVYFLFFTSCNFFRCVLRELPCGESQAEQSHKQNPPASRVYFLFLSKPLGASSTGFPKNKKPS